VQLIETIASQTNLPPLLPSISLCIRYLTQYLADFTREIPMILQT
jgi:hypothetical protein